MTLKKLQTMNPWYLLLLGVTASILLTEAIDAPLSILFRGYVAWDYLVTGAITAFLVSLTVASILVYLNILGRKTSEELLKQSEEKYRLLIENIPVVTYMGNTKDRTITFISPNVKEVDGYTPEEYYKLSSDNWWFGRIHSDDVESVMKAYGQSLREDKPLDIEYRIRRKDGKYIWLQNRAMGTYMKEGEMYFYGIFSDITKRKKMEDQIKASLREKDVLLREIHHRVKNNLQTISSLLRLQMRIIDEDRYGDIFRDIQNRIQVISLVHEKLYRSKDIANIDINDYINSLIKVILQSHGATAGRISVNVEHNDISFDIDKAVTCGLIVNELVSNAVKYAFPGSRNGEVMVAIRPVFDKEIELIVRDNGIGMQKDLDIKKVESLGMQLVVILSEEQLKGKIELNRIDGTEFRIKFNR
ncbi:MAG: PAS domain-containing protein [Nitrospinae bacterium]|nr:PAS domain-containing protein [Nitrospinota bacterium]